MARSLHGHLISIRSDRMCGCRGFDPMYRMMLPAALTLVLLSPARAQKDFPDAPAKEYVTKICLQCHEASQLLSQRKSESEWKATVARMAQKGISAPTEQFDAVAAYMAKYFPKQEDTTKINMNKAKADEIVKTIGLTPDEANALLPTAKSMAIIASGARCWWCTASMAA